MANIHTRKIDWKLIKLIIKLQGDKPPCGFSSCPVCCFKCLLLEECYTLWGQGRKRECPSGNGQPKWCSTIKESLDNILGRED